MNNNKNPFHYGSMIKDPHQFIGRRDELATITDRLNGSQVQGSAVCGPRRIGKSSLLYYLSQPRAYELLCANNTQLVIYLDAQANECSTPDDFRATLVRTVLDDARLKIDGRTTEGKILNEIQQRLENGESYSWALAKEVLDNLPIHPVICLDEFEALLTDHFDDRFFNALRSWANGGSLTWITASAETLKALGQARNSTSPFFNLLKNVPIGDLAEDEVDPLLDRADSSAYPLTAKERRIIRRVAQCNPYHLQIVAAAMWLRKQQGRRVSKHWAKAALEQQISKSAEWPKLSWPWHLFYIGIILLLLCSIAYEPLIIHKMLHHCLDIIGFLWTKLCKIWGPVANFIQELEAWVTGAVLVGILVSAIWKGKPLLEWARQLWEKLSG